jgi:two-component sensor histidine kinase
MMKRPLFAVAVTALLPAVAMLAYNEISNRQQRQAELRQETLSESRQAAFEMERIVDGIGNFLLAVSAVPAISDQDPASCANALARIVPGNPAINAIFLIGADGLLVCSSTDLAPGTSFSGESVVQRTLSRGELTVGDYSRDGLIGQNVLPVARPANAAANAPHGVLATAIRLDWLSARLLERGMEKGGALTIADRHGYIVARQPYPDRFIGTRIPDPYLPLITQAEPGTSVVMSQDGTERLIGFQPVAVSGTDLYVSSGVSMSEAFAQINRATLIGAIFIAAGTLVAAVAAWFVGNRFINQPIYHIVETLAAWRDGKLQARTHMVRGAGDLEEIGEAIDELLDELVLRHEAAAQAQSHRRLLMQELSHRVKNTLSIAISIANQMFKGSSGDVQAFSQRLSALAGAYDLLLAEDWNSAEIHTVIKTTLAPHLDSEQNRLRVDGPALMLPSEAVLALSLVLNELATNAVKYGALSVPGGEVSLQWQIVETTRPHSVHLDWQEQYGPPVEPSNKSGFGSKLLLLAFPSQFSSKITIDYAADGVRCAIRFQLPDTTNENAAA